MPAGRPFKLEFDETLIALVEALAEKGSTNDEIAEILGIHSSTFYRYLERLPELREAIKRGKSPADTMVEQALFSRALGYSFDEDVVTKAGDVVTVKRKVPPDVTAMIFWLKNRKPDLWREKTEVDHNIKSLHEQIIDALDDED
jgi:hypothetical protein